MPLDPDAAYQALTARDARFDGVWFVGVTSTGVYCRPICRVRVPKRENCRFFDSPAQAEAAAFRPCMKCRPEIAPGAGHRWTVMDASRTLAQQAAAQIDTQAQTDDETDTMAALAQRLGVSDRHLRRIFLAEHGVTPLQYLQTRRLLLAKQLLTDTRLPMSQVALCSGFKSLRRFNAAFVEHYRMSPGRLRGDAAEAVQGEEDAISVMLSYRRPCDLDALLRFVRQRAIPGIEVVDDLTIRRTVRAGPLAPEAGWVEASFLPQVGRVRLRFAPQWAGASGRLVAHARRWLDLDAAPDTIDAALHALPGAPGLRLPGSLDAFELAVRAVLGQQVTVAAARTLARRLVERFGEPLATPWADLDRVFPAPQVLAGCAVGDIASLGIIRTRSQAIIDMAAAWPRLSQHWLGAPDAAGLVKELTQLRGIGPWTANYIAMRALSWPDAFPPNDVAVLKAMKHHFGTINQAQADQHAQAWRPWRAYAVLRLWNSLETTP